MCHKLLEPKQTRKNKGETDKTAVRRGILWRCCCCSQRTRFGVKRARRGFVILLFYSNISRLLDSRLSPGAPPKYLFIFWEIIKNERQWPVFCFNSKSERVVVSVCITRVALMLCYMVMLILLWIYTHNMLLQCCCTLLLVMPLIASVFVVLGCSCPCSCEAYL